MSRQVRSPEERFWAKVDKTGSCWEWTAAKSSAGYGQFNYPGGTRAHRFAYEVSVGEIPDGKIVDHKCRNRACVNPAHLRLATRAENVQNQDGHADSRSGKRGVSWHKWSGKWRASATVAGTYYHGGYFSTVDEASEASRQLRLQIHTHNDIDRAAAA